MMQKKEKKQKKYKKQPCPPGAVFNTKTGVCEPK